MAVYHRIESCVVYIRRRHEKSLSSWNFRFHSLLASGYPEQRRAPGAGVRDLGLERHDQQEGEGKEISDECGHTCMEHGIRGFRVAKHEEGRRVPGTLCFPLSHSAKVG